MNAHTIFSSASRQYQKGQYTEALTSLNQLLDLTRDAKTYALLAKVLLKLGFRSDAAQAYQLAGEAGGLRSEHFLAEAMKLHFACGNDDEALSLGRPLLEQAKTDAELAYIIATLFLKRNQSQLLGPFKTTLSMSAQHEHQVLAAKLLTADIGNSEDREIVTNLFRRSPSNLVLLSAYLVFMQEVNNFGEIDNYAQALERVVQSVNPKFFRAETPFYNMHWCRDEALNRVAGALDKPFDPGLPAERRAMPHSWGKKIRIGYLSNDFWAPHATMKLLKAVLTAHDREKFDVTLFCYTPEKYLPLAGEERQTWGKIVRVENLSDEQAAQAIRDEQIDILVDLKGHTMHSRVAILNHKTAPVQVAWLGFPGTTVNVDIDYIIGDRYVLPDASAPHYYEQFCRLPETYQPNDPAGRPRPAVMSRTEAGLPEDAFVYASFNANRKIIGETVKAWAEILRRTPDSVLWLMRLKPEAEAHILRRFQSYGIATKRIIFSEKIEYEKHLARIPAADLGLDTFPCNGHTTTSEQLWMGLPVLTPKGTHFASRVSESLLNAIGLPELVAADVDDYIEQAVALYNDRDRVAGYKRTLEDNRLRTPLFDSERFCRHLEQAYEAMAERARDGLEPTLIDVPALPARTAPFAQ
ncbi:glycosyl transferase [Ensifer sp.]|uniref:O-linked N-acetylglucosamine transferase, SPINDLY family protein n=1 Tax=Ensifer sp. TaxID=1872086 RepID=UPI002899AF85|nr:glycosyl transferase [Ensifer sp.]